MPADLSIKETVTTNGKLHLLSLYADLPASVHARWVAGAIAKLASPHWRIASEMWKIDSIQISKPIQEMIANDAIHADVIIIAASSLTQSRPDLIQWLSSLETRKNGRHVSGLIIGMLGDEETTTDELDFVVRPLIRCAQQMGRNFIWHWMKSAMNDSDWLADGVNDLLSSKLAASNEDVCDRFFLAR